MINISETIHYFNNISIFFQWVEIACNYIRKLHQSIDWTRVQTWINSIIWKLDNLFVSYCSFEMMQNFYFYKSTSIGLNKFNITNALLIIWIESSDLFYWMNVTPNKYLIHGSSKSVVRVIINYRFDECHINLEKVGKIPQKSMSTATIYSIPMGRVNDNKHIKQFTFRWNGYSFTSFLFVSASIPDHV